MPRVVGVMQLPAPGLQQNMYGIQYMSKGEKQLEEIETIVRQLRCTAFPFVRTLSYKCKVYRFSVDHSEKLHYDPVTALQCELQAGARRRSIHLTHYAQHDKHQPVVITKFEFSPLLFADFVMTHKLGHRWYTKMRRYKVTVTYHHKSMPSVMQNMLDYQTYVLHVLDWVHDITANTTQKIKARKHMLEAIAGYKGPTFAELNKMLRGQGIPDTEAAEFWKKTNASLTEAIGMTRWKSPPRYLQCRLQDRMVFRGLYGEIAKSIINGRTKTLPNKAYSSFTLDPRHCLELIAGASQQPLVVLACTVDQGVPFCFVDAFNPHNFQAEILFGKDVVIMIDTQVTNDAMKYATRFVQRVVYLNVHVYNGRVVATNDTRIV